MCAMKRSWSRAWYEKQVQEWKLPQREEKDMSDNPFLGCYISTEARSAFTTLKGMSEKRPDKAAKLMIFGPSGYGKTLLSYLFAKAIGADYLRMNCANIRDPEEWFGYREAREGSTVFIRSRFITALEKGNIVVVLDEFNRLEPWLHNTLFPLLDDDGRTVVHDEEFVIGPNVYITGTINLGYKYTGIFELDEALLNRFPLTLEVGAMPANEERNVLVQRTGIEADKATKIVKMANILRQSNINCSTRTTLDISYAVAAGMTPREAFEICVVRRLGGDGVNSNSLRKQALDLINVEYAPYKAVLPANDVFALADDGLGVGPIEVEERDGYGVTLYHNTAAALAVDVRLIKLLQSLPFLGGAMSQGEAKRLAGEIRAGRRILIPLTGKPENVKDLAEEMTAYGLKGRFSDTDEKEVRIWEPA